MWLKSDDRKWLNFKRPLTYGPRHVETAAAIAILAGVYEEQGKYQQAEELLRRSVDIKETGFGPTHPLTATTTSSLASVLIYQGEYDEAEKLLVNAAKIHEKAWPPNNENIGLGLRLNLATDLEALAQV